MNGLHSKVVASFFLIVLLLVPVLSATATTSMFDYLEEAGKSLTEWFQEMAASLTEIVAAEERTQLLEALSDLSKDLYAIEQDKRLFIQLLKRDKLDKWAIIRRRNILVENIKKAREDLKKVGPLLLQKYQTGGREVDNLLTEATFKRKVWIKGLHKLPKDIGHRQAVIAEGERAVSALREANSELAKLITRL